MMETQGRYVSEEELAQMTDDEEKTIVECSLNGHECELDFYFDYNYLSCYRFSTERDKSSDKLELDAVLYTGRPLQYSLQRGFRLFVDDEEHYPLLSTPILVTTGLGRRIQLALNSYEQYPVPYSTCGVLEQDNELVVDVPDRSIFDMVLATNYSYSRDLCLLVFGQVLKRQACECQAYASYVLDEGNETLFCDTNLVCAPLTATDEANTSAVDYCMSRCPLECVRSAYTKTISTYALPASYFADRYVLDEYASDFKSGQLRQKNMTQFAYDTFVEFSVVYDASRSRTAYAEEPKMNGEELLAVIGGHLHLFLGMSTLSFVEVAELIVESLFALFFCRPKSRSSSKRRPIPVVAKRSSVHDVTNVADVEANDKPFSNP